MARMLYLRDIEVDVHVRCCACGHEGVLPRADLQRRFGPNYPVLSIAPHYRCSKCDSRDTESRPAPAHLTVVAAVDEAPEAPSLAGPLAALQGLLDAVRIRDEDEDEDSQEPAREEVQAAPPPAPKPTPKAAPKPAEPDDIPLEQLIADGPPAPESGRRPLWEPISLADMAARLEADEPDPEPEEPTAAVVEDDSSPLDATIAALRGMLDAGDEDAEPAETKHEDEEEDALPPVFSPKALVRSDFDEDDEDEFGGDTGFADELPDDDADEEPSEEEILAFAIRDPEKAPPSPSPPWERERGWEREPDDEPLDKTIAALRGMVEEAAAEPAETEDEPPARPRFSIVDSSIPDAAILDDAPRAPKHVDEVPETGTGEIDEPPKPRKSAQELEMEEALKALRALVESDDPDEEEHRPLSLAEIARQVEEASEDGPKRAPKALTPTDVYAPGERTPWDDGVDDGAATIDLADELQDDEAEAPKPAKPAPSPLDKTIAALRGMLELDGKRGR